jgi:hypothetical protein
MAGLTTAIFVGNEANYFLKRKEFLTKCFPQSSRSRVHHNRQRFPPALFAALKANYFVNLNAKKKGFVIVLFPKV